MTDTVLRESHEVVPFLTTLSLDVEGLVEAVRYAESQRALCTSNDVHGFSQMTVYDKAARGLREVYCGRDGWEKDETNNQAGICNPALKIRVVPCNFTIECGTSVEPTNRSPKGEVSKAKARCNATGWLPGLPDIEAQEGSEYKTWILGIYAVGGEPLKAELSFPVAFDGKYFTRFETRVILLRGSEDDDTPTGRRDAPEPTEVVDIPIARR
ncbi:hypothetical protein [Terricaulis silvestris]|uniref:Uncharacterized protein n=1 Tax=Terricaulis silvestris TaxID=2686094 RepID=A0A6I6N0W2_9CAUL|nr:hypothetical protein [Terricaulis silvestris]QGZ96973.1 hypothetical protein DSM104635_03838 [Terricaulis silvestris]